MIEIVSEEQRVDPLKAVSHKRTLFDTILQLCLTCSPAKMVGTSRECATKLRGGPFPIDKSWEMVCISDCRCTLLLAPFRFAKER